MARKVLAVLGALIVGPILSLVASTLITLIFAGQATFVSEGDGSTGPAFYLFILSFITLTVIFGWLFLRKAFRGPSSTSGQ